MNTIREIGTIRKKWRDRLPIALVFPHLYSVGMANLGFLSLYETLNREEDLVCERFFWSEDLSRLRSLESERPLRDFALVLFSVPFEADYPRVLQILLAAGLPLDPRKRHLPVLAGGIALWLNPRPLFPFLDGFLLGELEALDRALIEALRKGGENKPLLLEQLRQVPGFLHPEGPFPVSIAKAPELRRPLISHLRSPEAEFGECQLIEVTRGCGQGCRFCAAGYLYRPPRRPPADTFPEIFSELDPGVKVGLIGLEFLPQEEIVAFARELLRRGHGLSFSSLRVDALREELREIFSATRTLTLAPEAGSPRLRRIINKRLPEETILSAARRLKTWPVRRLKLYFMFGLPGETEEDLRAIPQLAGKIRELSGKEITVSLSPFVPKPWTPFQWARFEDPEILKKKARFLKRLLLRQGIKVSLESIRMARLQALLSRGKEDLAPLLKGLARGEPLSRLLKTPPASIRPVFSGFEPGSPLPWEEVVRTGLDRDFLFQEWEKALQAEESPPCPSTRKCRRCGACLTLYGSS